ncbi:gypsy/ty3 retroelement polyprotein [Tanacetum coccineum]
MVLATRTIANSSANDEPVTRQSVEDALAQIRQMIVGLGAQNNQGARQANQFSRLAKVEFSKFNGDDVLGWMFKCDQFFLIDNTLEEEKVKIISVHLFDKALLWHRQLIKTKGENISWTDYKDAIALRFGSVYDDPMALLKNAKYDKSAKEYTFDTLLSRVEVSEEHAISLYLGGLPTELEMSVRMFRPKTLSDAYCLTTLQEATLEAVKKKSRPFTNQSNSRFGVSNASGTTNKLALLPPTPGLENNSLKRSMKRKGQRIYASIVIRKEEEFLDADDSLVDTVNEGVQAHISLNALSGISSFQTMRVIGLVVKQHQLHILVDLGSTHNFLDVNMAKRILWQDLYQAENTWSLLVSVKIFSGSCMATHLLSDVMLLPCDMVLGSNGFPLWETLNGTFKTSNPKVEPRLHEIIDAYVEVFAVPTKLPPLRSQDHKIPLMHGTQPVNIRPYRHPPVQKDAIEAMVKELLDAGVIKHSQSSFASHVVMVNKKDNSWRMCVDYRQLNKHTIKDKFRILISEELIDELHGSAIFTKLDLRSSYHQIRMYEDDIAKTAFRTHEGHYEFLVMPFGLTNAPLTVLMNDVFREYLRKFTLVFFDDILIYSKSLEDHIQHLSMLLLMGFLFPN